MRFFISLITILSISASLIGCSAKPTDLNQLSKIKQSNLIYASSLPPFMPKEFIKCGAHQFSFNPSSAWTYGLDKIMSDESFQINADFSTDYGSYDMKYTTGTLKFNLIEGNGHFLISRKTDKSKISLDNCEYSVPQSTQDSDFFTMDFCLGRTDRIDSAILEDKPISLSKRYLGFSPFICALKGIKDLSPYLGKRSKYLAFNPNEIDENGKHPLFFLVGDRLKSYIESFKNNINFEVRDDAGNTILHLANSKELLATLLNNLPNRTEIFKAENNDKLQPIEFSAKRYNINPTSVNLELLQILIEQPEIDINRLKGINLLEGVLRNDKFDYLNLQISSLLLNAKTKKYVNLTSELKEIWNKKVSTWSDDELGSFYKTSFSEEFYPEISYDVCKRLATNVPGFAKKIVENQRGGKACIDIADQNSIASSLFYLSSSQLYFSPNGQKAFSLRVNPNKYSKEVSEIKYFDLIKGQEATQDFYTGDGSALANVFNPDTRIYDVVFGSEDVSVITSNSCLYNRIGSDAKFKSTFNSKKCSQFNKDIISDFGIIWEPGQPTSGCFNGKLYDSYNDNYIDIPSIRINTSNPRIRIVRSKGFFSDIAVLVRTDPYKEEYGLLMPGSPCSKQPIVIKVRMGMPYSDWSFKFPTSTPNEYIEHVVLDNNNPRSMVKLVSNLQSYSLPASLSGFDGEFFYELKNTLETERSLNQLKIKEIKNLGNQLEVVFTKINNCKFPSGFSPNEKRYPELINSGVNFHKMDNGYISFLSRSIISPHEDLSIEAFKTKCFEVTPEYLTYKAYID